MELDSSPFLAPVTMIIVLVILIIGAIVLYKYEIELFNNESNFNKSCACPEPITQLKPYLMYGALVIFLCFILVMFVVFYLRFGRVKKGEIA